MIAATILIITIIIVNIIFAPSYLILETIYGDII